MLHLLLSLNFETESAIGFIYISQLSNW